MLLVLIGHQDLVLYNEHRCKTSTDIEVIEPTKRPAELFKNEEFAIPLEFEEVVESKTGHVNNGGLGPSSYLGCLLSQTYLMSYKITDQKSN